MVAQGSCNGSSCALECKKALLAAIGALDGSCCDQLGRRTDALSMPHCDEDANRPTDEAVCRLWVIVAICTILAGVILSLVQLFSFYLWMRVCVCVCILVYLCLSACRLQL